MTVRKDDSAFNLNLVSLSLRHYSVVVCKIHKDPDEFCKVEKAIGGGGASFTLA